MNKVKSTDPKSSQIIDMLKDFTSPESTQNINSGTNEVKSLINSALTSETSPIFNKSSNVNVISLKTVNISEIDSESQKNISTDYSAEEYNNKTDLESLFSRMVNSEMSEEINDKSGNTKSEFSVFSEYIKLENNAKSKQYSESKGKVEHNNGRNSQAHVSQKSNFPEVKICKNCLIPYINKHCCLSHNKSDMIVDTMKKTSTSAVYENNSNSLNSKSHICSHSDSKFTQDVDNDLSEVDLLKTSIPQDNISSFSSLMETNTVVVSKLIDIRNPYYVENANNSSACVFEESKVMVSSNCLSEGNALDTNTVCTNAIENDSKKHFCPYCSKCFGFLFTLERHIRSHDMIDPFQRSDSPIVPEVIYGESSNNSFSCVTEEGKDMDSSNCLFKKKPLNSGSLNFKEIVGSRHICRVCLKGFRFRSTLERHIHSHKITKNAFQGRNSAILSKITDKENPDSRGISTNVCSINRGKKMNSSICLLEENSLNSDTMRPHSKENYQRNRNKHVCPHCAKSFIFSATLERHIRSHNIHKYAFQRRNSILVPKTIGINIPDSGEDSNSSLQHIMNGKEMDSSICLLEKNSFDSDAVHPNLKDYTRNKHICPSCSKCFRFRSSLERHIRSHNILVNTLQVGKRSKYLGSGSLIKERPVILKTKLRLLKKNFVQKCPYCSRTFEYPSKLVPHFKIIDEPPYTCHLCLIRFSELYKFSAHIQIVHRETQQYFCDLCRKIFRNISHFRRHVQIHKRGKPFFCNECAHSYRSSKELSFHICNYKKSQHQCVVCGKCFQKKSILIHHYLIHNNEKPYPCKLCDYRAKQRYLLKIHILRNHKLSFSE